jgi:putative addiction module component (TIGR02574 family)
MTRSPDPFDFSHLSVAERILLAQQLWESVHTSPEASPLTDAEKQELERRWKAFEAGEMTGSSWPEVKQDLLRR